MKEIQIYQNENGMVELEVNFEEETVWLNLNQLSQLFCRDKSVISRHIKKIFETEELNENSTVAFFATVQNEGGREIRREIEYYNLDVIISVGYRVNSKEGTKFRIWATSVLKEYLVQGYAINQKRLKMEKQKVEEMYKTMQLLERTVRNQAEELSEAQELIKIVSEYSYALSLLDDYDHQRVKMGRLSKTSSYLLTYAEAIKLINSMKTEFSSSLFGNEKDDSFKGSLGALYQTAFGEEVYKSVEEKAVHLLYFVVKNHSFSDGNKRIAAALFTYFMYKNGILYSSVGKKRIADNTLVAIVLMIAESSPTEKDIIAKVLVNLINEDNDA